MADSKPERLDFRQQVLAWLDAPEAASEQAVCFRLEAEFRAVLASMDGNPARLTPEELLTLARPRMTQLLGPDMVGNPRFDELAASSVRNVLAITTLLRQWKEAHEDQAEAHLLELIHVELEAIARRHLSHWPGLRTTVEPKDLVNDLFFKLRQYCPPVIWRNRQAFWAMVSKALRRVLLDMSRGKPTRPPSRLKVDLSEVDGSEAFGQEWDELEFRLALDRLEQVDERQRKVLEYHAVLGISQQEIADELGVSLSTVRRDLQLAKTWIQKRWISGRGKPAAF